MILAILLGISCIVCNTIECDVTVYKPEKAYNGYTLFCESFNPPQRNQENNGTIYLIDMQGNPVHKWYVKKTAQQSFCRLLPNGNLLYPTRDRSQIEQAGLRELNPDSQVVWYYHCRIDHDYQVLDTGNFLIHTIADYMWPELGHELKRHPYIIEITRDKKLIWEWRGEEHISELQELLSPEAWKHF